MTATNIAVQPACWMGRVFATTLLAISAAASPGLISPAAAAEWPNAPITFIAPFSAGGGGDTLVRLYGNQLTKVLGVPIVVENRPGAGGNIGTALAARATPDANTVVFGTTGTMATNHALYTHPGFSVDDFEPVAMFGSTALALVVGKESPFRSVQDIVKAAKANPGKLSCATSGNGTISHIACAMFEQRANIRFGNVPYRSGSAALVDVRSGRVDFIIDVLPYLIPQIHDGAVRALAVSTKRRVAALPNTPTMIENGVADYDVFTWDGLFTRKGAPVARLDKLNAAVETVIRNPEFRKTMTERGTSLEAMSRQQFAEFVRNEHVRMVDFTKKLGVTIE